MKMRKSLIGNSVLVLALMVALSSCGIIGVASTATGVGVLHTELEKERFSDRLDDAAQAYLKDHANSPCTNDEDKVMPELLVYIKEQGKRHGVDRAIKRLNAIYEDETYSEDVRASALYHIAVIHFRKEYSNPRLGVHYLVKIHDEFPGEYQCIFEDTPWRREMIKKLHIPEDTLPAAAFQN
ncbi:MAG: hypothetical protein MI864_16065 [Pseudomonadales bacterium]|uniref:Lipoprotein n=1 Tax=Oleiphilus messinensis TaxID=141451 RepID=A0A1Y0I2F3_9GAMM|nr:hypothetical protein [Oleiphilus messinensis]ARU54581.1 hypothetical protein OLMES_0477 [Oleiphilus messinensis]MCG8612042.1 hypothetical protein [Pseudomonadales bacterium]